MFALTNDGLIGELQKSWWVRMTEFALTVADDVVSSMSARAFLESLGQIGEIAKHFDPCRLWLAQF